MIYRTFRMLRGHYAKMTHIHSLGDTNQLATALEAKSIGGESPCSLSLSLYTLISVSVCVLSVSRSLYDQ